MLNVLITAGGVTTVWHMVNIAKKYFSDKICIHLCDTNERELVPAATMADHYYQVPGFKEEEYYSHMLKLLEENHIDVIVPLIDQDLFIWSRDNSDLKRLGVFSTGPYEYSAQTLSDKKQLVEFLERCQLSTPRLVTADEAKPDEMYIIKSQVGCGSNGVICVKGSDVPKNREGIIIQEKCDGLDTEVTAEIFNTKELLRVFCRYRVATKSGVCTKMKPADIPEIQDYIARLVQNIECPEAFCAQFLKHRGKWCLIDCNLRMGAGTALSSAAGFQLVRAFWANLCGDNVQSEWLNADPSVKTVLRVYEEIVVR